MVGVKEDKILLPSEIIQIITLAWSCNVMLYFDTDDWACCLSPIISISMLAGSLVASRSPKPDCLVGGEWLLVGPGDGSSLSR